MKYIYCVWKSGAYTDLDLLHIFQSEKKAQEYCDFYIKGQDEVEAEYEEYYYTEEEVED